MSLNSSHSSHTNGTDDQATQATQATRATTGKAPKQGGLYINTDLNSLLKHSSSSTTTATTTTTALDPKTTRSLEALLVKNPNGNNLNNLASARVNARLDRGFFVNENQEWTSYRRNYFKVSVGFTLHSTTSSVDIGNNQQELHLARNGCEFKSFQVSLVGRNRHSEKTVELIQHNPKREKSAIDAVRPVTLSPGGNPFKSYSNITSGGLTPPSSAVAPTIVTFDRVQFKKATANNGKRKAAQQFYSLDVELYGITQSNERVLVSVVSSAPLVIRGRSPGHYSTKPLKINVSRGPISAGPSSAASVPEESLVNSIQSSFNMINSTQSSFNINMVNSTVPKSPFNINNSNINMVNSSVPKSPFNSNINMVNSSVPKSPFNSNINMVNSAANSLLSPSFENPNPNPISASSGNWIRPNESSPQSQSYIHVDQFQFKPQSFVDFNNNTNNNNGNGNGFGMMAQQQVFQNTNYLYPQHHHHDNNLVLTSPFPVATPSAVPFQGFFPESFYHKQEQFFITSPPLVAASNFLNFQDQQSMETTTDKFGNV